MPCAHLLHPQSSHAPAWPPLSIGGAFTGGARGPRCLDLPLGQRRLRRRRQSDAENSPRVSMTSLMTSSQAAADGRTRGDARRWAAAAEAQAAPAARPGHSAGRWRLRRHVQGAETTETRFASVQLVRGGEKDAADAPPTGQHAEGDAWPLDGGRLGCTRGKKGVAAGARSGQWQREAARRASVRVQLPPAWDGLCVCRIRQRLGEIASGTSTTGRGVLRTASRAPGAASRTRRRAPLLCGWPPRHAVGAAARVISFFHAWRCHCRQRRVSTPTSFQRLSQLGTGGAAVERGGARKRRPRACG